MPTSRTKREILEVVITILITFVLMVGVPAFSFFALGGAELGANVFDKLVFYFALGIASMLALAALNTGEILSYSNPGIYARFGWLRGIIHDPEIGILYNIPALHRFLKASFLIKFGIVVFSIFGIFAVVNNTFFIGLPQTEFQVTKTADVILATEPAATSETLFFGVFLSLMLGITHWLGKSKNFGSGFYGTMALLVIPVVNGLLWMAYHAARYSGQEKSLLAVFLFGWTGAVLVALTGSLILWLLLHQANNLFQKSNQIFSNDAIVIVVIAFLLLFIITTIVLAVRRKNLNRTTGISLEGIPAGTGT